MAHHHSWPTLQHIISYKIAMQAQVLPHSPAQADPTAGFHLTKFDSDMPYCLEILSQFCPAATK